MFHINQSIDKFQQQNESLLEQVERLDNTLHHRDQHIVKLEAAAIKQDEVFLYILVLEQSVFQIEIFFAFSL